MMGRTYRAKSHPLESIWRGGATALTLALILTIAGCGGDSSSPPLATPVPTPTPMPTPTPATGGTFAPAASTPSMNHARKNATATLLNNGRVLIAGGDGASASGELNSVELYDPATNSFAPPTSLPTMNTARSSATATLLFSGKVLIAGGGIGEGGFFTPLNTVELYDPATNSFAPAASLPIMNTARQSAAAVLLPNGEVLIAGGFGSTFPFDPIDSVELYNPVTNSFASAASLPTMSFPRASLTATSLPNGKVLVAGGIEGFALNITLINSSADLYDPATNSFAASTPQMNAARFDATAALLPNGNVLIGGGIGPGPPGPFTVTLSAVDLYSPATNSFAPAAATPTMNHAREGATATLLNNGKLLIAGGSGTATFGTATFLASVDLYDPATNTFAPVTLTPTMNNGRTAATATLLPNGKVLIAGGQGVFGPTNSVELYIP
jgi:N-acetylneuraminic acid mutarotase